MRVFAVTCLAMVAFAANSVLNRLAVGAGHIDPVAFAVVRVGSGAVALALLVALRHGLRGRAIWAGWAGRGAGVFGLLVYLFGFSFAYLSLAAGSGALILFGTVQITMFAGALIGREAVPLGRWLGAGVAFAGLVLLLVPIGGIALPLGPSVLMALAGVGWGIYSLAGRASPDALLATAWNFLLAAPVAVVIWSIAGASLPEMGPGIWLAVVSGALTSGVGYALWYVVVPALGASRAAVAQLTVPVIAAVGGALMIDEAITLRMILAACLVLGGVALASFARRS